MKNKLALSFALFQALVVTSLAADIQLPLVSSGAMQRVGGYIPQKAATSGKPPASLKKAPADLLAPAYGEIKFGPKEAPQNIVFVVDEPAGKPWRLFVDANANGDLTDDPPSEWKMREVKGRDGKTYQQGSGSAMLALSSGDAASKVRVAMYRFDQKDPARTKDALFYYPDYARIGSLALGGKKLSAILHDEFARGDFRDAAAVLKLDVNEDGKFDFRSESFKTSKPFNIGGTTYEVTGVTASGSSFEIVKSEQSVPETKPLAVVLPGKLAPAFEATTITGEKIKLPDSYKGKIVLLDFWATWCGPCIGELPNLIKAYETHHAKGLEVLGISLDSGAKVATLPDFLKAKNMTWPQVCDGKGWEASIGQLYSVHSIPAAFLIDGTTGLVLATQGLRGSELSETIQAALSKKPTAGNATPAASATPPKTAPAPSDKQSHLNALMELYASDRDQAVKATLEGLEKSPTEQMWGLELEVIFQRDEFRGQALQGEERIRFYQKCRDYLKRGRELAQQALKQHPENDSLPFGLERITKSLAIASLETGDTAEARRLAREQLAANTNTNSWNYGNVIYSSYATLGRAALRDGDKKAAVDFLLKAGDTPGSPQLNTFGPNFIFPREMLEAGETQAVLDFFDLVEKFWVDKMSKNPLAEKVAARNKQKLDLWRAEVRAGKVPDFRP